MDDTLFAFEAILLTGEARFSDGIVDFAVLDDGNKLLLTYENRGCYGINLDEVLEWHIRPMKVEEPVTA